jgi:phage terminase large subunit-like protein
MRNDVMATRLVSGPWLRALSDRPETATTTSTTYDNLRHLAPSFIRDVISRYEGSRLGRQELLAEWLDDVEGARYVGAEAFALAKWRHGEFE